MPTLSVQLFDPVFVDTALTCNSSNFTTRISGTNYDAQDALNPYHVPSNSSSTGTPQG